MPRARSIRSADHTSASVTNLNSPPGLAGGFFILLARNLIGADQYRMRHKTAATVSHYETDETHHTIQNASAKGRLIRWPDDTLLIT